MTYIVYLIKHLDNDMKYVGITSTDLKTRWDQHRNDPNSAVYKALRADGHRMVMEALEKCDTRQQALRREQEFIHELGTAAPRGWNRKVKRKPKKYKSVSKFMKIDGELHCPVCSCENMHFLYEDAEIVLMRYEHPEQNIVIGVMCEECHHDDNDCSPPPYSLLISDDNGTVHFFIKYFIEEQA